MSWKPSELLVVGLVIGAVFLWRTSGTEKADGPPVRAPEMPAAANLPPPVEAPTAGDIELAAEQLMLNVGGMAECKLEGVLPMPAVNKYGELLSRIDSDAFLRGAEKSVLMLKGLALKPRSPACKEVRKQLEKNAALYQKIAEQLP